MRLSRRLRNSLLVLVALGLSPAPVAPPALAHEERPHNAAQAGQPASDSNLLPVHPPPGAQGPHERSPSKSGGLYRLLDWMGRLHPILIHFPLAFFPAALLTAIVGRRRPAFAQPVQFLIIAGGVSAPLAMALGWLQGGLMLTDSDPLLRVHRWLGTAIGLASLGLALWAWRRPDQDRGPGMLAALAVITAALIVQGWYGGALVHGADHLKW